MRVNLILFFVIFFLQNTFAQGITFGKVVDENNQPMVGVSILIPNTTIGTITSAEGDFEIKNVQQNLLFKFIGYEDVLIENPEGKLDVKMIRNEQLIAQIMPEGIVVLDKRIKSAHNYSLLDREMIQLENQSNLSPVLNSSAGVFMHSGALNTNRITIRGIGSRSPFSTNKIKAYLNEIPLTNGSGETTVEDIDLSFIENIEVWKGPTSSSFGAGLGGAILLNTQVDQDVKPAIVTENTIGSFGLYRNATHLFLTNKEEQFNLHLNYNYTHSDGYRENNEYDRQGFTLLSDKGFGKNKLQVLLNFTQLKAFIPSSLNEQDFLNEPTKAAFTWGRVMGFEDYDRLLAGLTFEQAFGKSAGIKYSFFINNRQSYESRPFNILTENSNAIGTRLSLDLFKTNFKFNWKIGTELFRETYNWETFVTNSGQLGEPLSINKELRVYSNFFTEGVYRFDENFKLNAGLNFNATNYDLEDRFFSDSLDFSGDYSFDPVFSPRLALSYSPKNNLDFYVLASHGFSPPTLEETLTPEGNINPDIEPEKAWNFEIGTRQYHPHKKLRYELSIYTMRVADLLVARRTGFDQFVGVNAGRTTHTGVEVHTEYFILKNKESEASLNFNYTYSSFKFDEFLDEEEDFFRE